MRIISVAAPGNGSGKTLTLSAILGAFPGRLSAIKFTTVFRDGVNCPRTERSCACRSLHGRFTVVTDPAILEMEQTDTGRLARAGARCVLWCLARPGAHAEAWRHLRTDLLPAGQDLITEGNSVIPVLNPDLLVMVMSPALERSRWKQDAWDLARRADHVVINPHGSPADEIEALRREVARERGGTLPPVEDVSRRLEEWRDPALRRLLESLLAPGAGPE